MGKKILAISLVTLLLVLVASASFASSTFSGELKSVDNQITGTGTWFPISVSWTVSKLVNGLWHYDYTVATYQKDLSHLIIECSATFDEECIFNAQVNGTNWMVDVDYYAKGSSGNPGIPDDINGIKFDATSGTDIHVTFDSSRAPVWGDIYLKDGAGNVAWNGDSQGLTGFTYPDTDPVVPVTNGTISNHIIVPDTVDDIVPEPAGMLALGAGIMSLLGFVIRKK